jgi:predicted house-cleaning NTP pyrophosphatase (Maf/HAM1 superfamily)
VKKVDRQAQLAEIAKGKELKHAETQDKSAPVIAADTRVEKSQRPALFAEIASKASK